MPTLTPWIALIPLVSVVVAGALGYALGLRRMKYERTWQARYETHQQILSALHDVYYWAEESYARHKMLPSVSSQKLDELASRFDDAKHRLSSCVHTGDLVVSAAFRELLQEILREIAQEEFRADEELTGDEESRDDELAEHYDRLRSIVSAHLDEVKKLARAQLR